MGGGGVGGRALVAMLTRVVFAQGCCPAEKECLCLIQALGKRRAR
jgi:hypothetical protein